MSVSAIYLISSLTPRRVLQEQLKGLRAAFRAPAHQRTVTAASTANSRGPDEEQSNTSNKPPEMLLTEPSYQYLLDHTEESEALRSLRERTSRDWSKAKQMQVSPEQGRFLAWLAASLGVEHAIEIGVFTGYSSICLAQSVSESGYLVACESDLRPLELAQRAFVEAGVAHKINLQIGDAQKTLQTLLDNSYHDHFDFAFIDADKRSYWQYHERLLKLVRRGGTLVYDNILWYGAAADPKDTRKSTVALRKFSRQLLADSRVQVCFVPIGDGMALCRRL